MRWGIGMGRHLVTSLLPLLLAVGCTKPAPSPTLLSEMPPVHLCYELIARDQRRGVEVFQELQRRGETCDKYQQQVAMMLQARARPTVVNIPADDPAMNFGAMSRANQQSVLDAYMAPQRALQRTAPVNCTSTGFGGVINTTCR